MEADPELDPFETAAPYRAVERTYVRGAGAGTSSAPPARWCDVRALSAKWFEPAFVSSFGADWWRAAQARFLDHADSIPEPIWATTGHVAWLWFAWARTYPLPIAAEDEFGMWRPTEGHLSDHGRRHWDPDALELYCALWGHLWDAMRERN